MTFDEFKPGIATASAQCAKLLETHGMEVEPKSVALEVERHRHAHKPQNVRLLLLAESHVFTNESDCQLKMRNELLPKTSSDLPDSFVRLIYCLGYGQSQLLTGKPSPKTSGTRFWEIFRKLSGVGLCPLGCTQQEKLHWKLDILERLKERGIWLVDSSSTAIYCPQGTRVPNSLSSDFSAIWFTNYINPMLAEMDTVPIWAIGKAVYNIVNSRISLAGFIYQPQAARGKNGNVDMNHGWDELLQDVLQNCL